MTLATVAFLLGRFLGGTATGTCGKVEVLYTKFSQPLEDESWARRLKELPVSLHKGVLRYRRWRDRHASLFGKLLLAEGLRNHGLGGDRLGALRIDGYGRPYLKGQPDFSISHSGDYVVCCVSVEGRVGIDIERIREVNLSGFRSRLHPELWTSIHGASDPYSALFTFWTGVESVLKADGRGLSVPPSRVGLKGGVAELDGAHWFVHEIGVDPEYRCSLAVNWESPAMKISEVDFYAADSERGERHSPLA